MAAAVRPGRRSGNRRRHMCLLTPIRYAGLGMQKQESGLTAGEIRKGRNVGEEGALTHAVRPGYSYDKVRELRASVPSTGPVRSGCIEEKSVQVGSEKDP